MNIMLALNNAYTFPTLVMLKSLFENNAREHIDIYCLYNDLSDNNLDKLKMAVEQWGGDGHFIYVNPAMFSNMPLKAMTNSYITVETYFRLAMKELLPLEIERILYLDTDAVINKNLSALYNVYMDNETLAVACEDAGIYYNKKIRKIVYANLEFENSDKYFNAGVMLLNLKGIRKTFSLDDFLEIVNEKYDRLLFHDQDVLNLAFKDKVRYIDYCTYNCRPFYYAYTKGNELQIKNNAAIIHYGEKPWNDSFSDMLGDVFWKYACEAGFNDRYSIWKSNNAKWLKANQAKVIFNRIKRNIKFAFIHP